MFKKLLSFIVATVAVCGCTFALTACNEDPTPEPPAQTGNPPAETEEPFVYHGDDSVLTEEDWENAISATHAKMDISYTVTNNMTVQSEQYGEPYTLSADTTIKYDGTILIEEQIVYETVLGVTELNNKRTQIYELSENSVTSYIGVVAFEENKAMEWTASTRLFDTQDEAKEYFTTSISIYDLTAKIFSFDNYTYDESNHIYTCTVDEEQDEYPGTYIVSFRNGLLYHRNYIGIFYYSSGEVADSTQDETFSGTQDTTFSYDPLELSVPDEALAALEEV